VKLPVFFWRKQRFGAEEAAARLSESRENYQATQQELILATKDQYFKIRSSERLLDLYRSGILPQASLALESAVASYEVGAVDFLTLLNSQATVLTYEMQYYEELAKHEQALARLEPLVARELTKP
jgi:outer membrane protein TolC